MKSLARIAVALCGLLTLGSFSVAQTPPFASSYSWTSTGPLISAKSDSTHNIIAVKDPSAILYNGRWVIYASTVNSAGSYGMEYLNVAEDWSDAATATPTFLNLGGTAPQVFYFAPQKQWYLISQWSTNYSTNSDPTKPLNWSAQKSIGVQMPSGVTGIDFWVICDSTNCYLFFCADNGSFYRASTPIGNFPNGFSTPVVVASDSQFAMFEAGNVYTVEGGGYLANIEALGSTGRYFRALWANSLGGTWYDLGDTASFSTPFLGINNTTFESGVSAWTTSFSSGGMLIDGNDQTDSINPNNLAFLYQGASQQAYQNDSYGAIPWQLGVAYSKANTTTSPSFTLSRSASTLSVTQGSSATDTVTVTPENGFTGSVTFTASGLPSGVTASFSPTSSTSSSLLTLTASSTATTGSSTVTITGTSGSTKATTTIALTVNAKVTTGFSLSASASSLSVTQGSSGTDTIKVTDIGGFTGSVAFTAAGMPSGVTASFNPTSSTSSSVLTLTASSTATTGAFTITVTGTSGTTATTSFTLNVGTSGGGSTPVYIDAGGAASGSWAADEDFSGGTAYTYTNAVSTSLLSGTVPPQTVLQSQRYGSFTYTIPGYTAGTSHTVTLYFVESYVTAAGQREFNVLINGTQVLTNYDVYAAAGGQFIAVQKSFTATANSSGQIVIQFSPGAVQNPFVTGIALDPSSGGSTALDIDAGGAASGSWVADEDFSGGTALTYTNAVTTSLLSGTVPPQTVLQSQRYGSFTYTIPGYTSGSSHTVTLYFVENYVTGTGQREFNVLINGTQVLTNYDVYAAAGGQFMAVQKSFTTTANSSGQIVIQFSSGAVQSPLVSGIAVQ
jgi:hypothetical protein